MWTKEKNKRILRKQRDIRNKQQQNDKQKPFCLDIGDLTPLGIKKEKKKSSKVAFGKEKKREYRKVLLWWRNLEQENNDKHSFVRGQKTLRVDLERKAEA